MENEIDPVENDKSPHILLSLNSGEQHDVQETCPGGGLHDWPGLSGICRHNSDLEGRLLLCLGNEHSMDLRAVLRQPGSTQQDLQQAIIQSMELKPEKHHFDLDAEPEILRFMNMTGG